MHVQRATLVVCLLIVLGSAATPGFAQSPPLKDVASVPVQPEGNAAHSLPLRRVTLYKSGVGYFEHGGTVHGNEDVEINLTSSQLDDVLESLTAIDLNGGHVSGASYNLQEPSGHQMQSVSVPLARTSTLGALLQELRGARLELTAGSSTFSGRLLSVEERSRGENSIEVKFTELTLMSDSGEVRQFPIDAGTALRFTDPALEQELARALGLMDASHAQDTRRLILSATGSGVRELHISYISEVPVWKTTYRIVLPGVAQANAKPLLQGWAIVDDTVGEDWENVQLSLAAGAPQSFMQAISQPYYTQRPVVPMPQGFLLSPQTHEATLVGGGELKKNAVGQVSEMVTVEAAGMGTINGANRNSTQEFALPNMSRNTTGTAVLGGRNWQAQQSTVSGAGGEKLGEIFEYNLKDPVTIRKNQSALVPIVQTDIKAEKVALWNAAVGLHPLLALWLTNSSPMTLDGGSFSVVDAGAFSGEGLMDAVQPGERRLISYAGDLATQVVVNTESGPEKITRVRISHGVIVTTSELRQQVIYKIRDEDTAPRTVVIEHPNQDGWKLVENLKPEETAADVYRFRVPVAAKETAEFTVEQWRPNSAQYGIRDLNQATLQFLVDRRELSPEAEKVLREVLAREDAIASVAAQVATRQAEYDEIFKDQSRLRDNLKALQSSPEQRALVLRYIKEMDDQETHLETLRAEIKQLKERKDKAQDELNATIEELSFDIKL